METDKRLPSSISFLNGFQQESVPIDDRGFQYGDGLFETMLLENRRIPLINFHLDRLHYGCTKLGISLNGAKVREDLDVMLSNPGVRAIDYGKIKLTVTRGYGGRGCYPPKSNAPNVYIQASEIARPSSEGSLDLVIASRKLPFNEDLAGIKHLNRLHYIFACQDTEKTDDQEILFLDKNSNIVETMHHNIFFVKNDVLITPKINVCGVAGIMRKTLISILAPRSDIEVREEDISVEKVKFFDSCFLANALRGFIPVRKLGSHLYEHPRKLTLINSALDKVKSEQ